MSRLLKFLNFGRSGKIHAETYQRNQVKGACYFSALFWVVSTNLWRSERLGTPRLLHTTRLSYMAVPLLGIMGIALTGVTSFCIYALFTKNDVMLDHHSKIPPWEKSIDQLNPKIINLHSIQKLNPEIRKLKDEINNSD